jgi:hypothetical protein
MNNANKLAITGQEEIEINKERVLKVARAISIEFCHRWGSTWQQTLRIFNT